MMFGIQKTPGSTVNRFRSRMNAEKSIAETIKAAKDGTLDESQGAETMDALDTARYGDRTERTAKADAALASVK